MKIVDTAIDDASFKQNSILQSFWAVLHVSDLALEKPFFLVFFLSVVYFVATECGKFFSFLLLRERLSSASCNCLMINIVR